MSLTRACGWALVAVAGLLSRAACAQDSFPVVPTAAPNSARPFVWMVSTPNLVHGPGQNCSDGNPCFYLPADIQRAYATTLIPNGNGGAGATIAIVDAFHNPQAEADLNTFSVSFGLPPCTSASGCFTQVSQTGGPPSAEFNASWALETNLDLQWAHVVAPNAKILLVEGTTNSLADLGAAALYAQARADVVSNSYGASEGAGETSLDFFFSNSPVPLLFSAGDAAAAGHAYPCASIYAVCVGGTSLQETVAGFRNVETGWANGGGGCSTIVTAPDYQAPFSNPLCGTFRGMPDVAALADPNSGVAVYLGEAIQPGAPGLYLVGGTSLACPLTAAIIAQIQVARVAAGKPKFGLNLGSAIYSVASGAYHYRFYDVTAGNNGQPAGPGYDLSTGLGVILGPAFATALVMMQ